MPPRFPFCQLRRNEAMTTLNDNLPVTTVAQLRELFRTFDVKPQHAGSEVQLFIPGSNRLRVTTLAHHVLTFLTSGNAREAGLVKVEAVARLPLTLKFSSFVFARLFVAEIRK